MSSIPIITSKPDHADQLFEKLIADVQSYQPHASKEILEKAYRFAASRHGPQQRQSGEAYITHPLEVARILTELRLDQQSIQAAILHDVVEDTSTSLQEVEQSFGPVVAELVDGLTKLGKLNFTSKHERLAENFRKMVVAMSRDIRVILIKLADRLHNMRTLGHLPLEKAKRIAQETLDIYAPLANRLGVYGIKSELEDLCLRYLKNEVYKNLREKIAAKKAERQAFIDEVKNLLELELKKYGFKNAIIQGRPKHFYSIYKKMIDRQLEFEEIHDLFAFRILVDSIKDCYEALGVVHAMWKPMPGRFKDYIAMPKANMYQSLHTTVIRPNGEPAEIQIRTHEMNTICEFGVAAHWSYKEKKSATGETGGSGGNRTDLEKFSWLRQMVQWQSELKDPNEFMEALKVDLFDEEIFVFTPKGDVISLPRNSSALDFAFAVHTGIGLKTIGAKVNGRIAPLKKILKSGDIVEILTSTNQKPTKDWLSFVTTTKAKSKIRANLRLDEREASRKLGRDMLEKACSQRHIDLDKFIRSTDAEKILKSLKENTFDDLLIAIGYGKRNAEDVLVNFQSDFNKTQEYIPPSLRSQGGASSPQAKKSSNASGILVSGLENVLVNFAKCCSPLPGEDVVGFITRGKGVSIHRRDCSKALDFDPHRRIEVAWLENSQSGSHQTSLKIVTREKQGILAEITSAIASANVNIVSASSFVNQDLLGVHDFVLIVNHANQLDLVVRKLENIPAVISVERKSQIRPRGIHKSASSSKKRTKGKKKT